MHPKYLAALAFAALILPTAACQEQPQTHAGGTGTGPVEVGIVTVETQNMPLTTELPGRTTAYRVAEVRPQVTGIVLKRLFEEGSEVAAGQQLYQIDPATYQASVQSAQADLAKAKANLKSVEAKATRYADLVKINAVSRQDYDDVVASLDQAKAQIQVSQAAVDTARISLDYTKVYAPISGRIGKSSVTEGALVTANQATLMATITQLDPIYVDLNQSSSELMRLRMADGKSDGATEPTKVQLLLDGSDTPYDLPGQLKFTDVTIDPSTGAVQLRAEFPNPRRDLYPGLFVRARVAQGIKNNVALVPQPALIRNPDGSTTVWVVGADHKVNPRPVQVGPAVGGNWRIDGGLQSGDQVVVSGLQKIRPGAEVRTTPANTALAERP